MKPLILYHDNCADGFGAAFAAWLKFGDEAEYIPCQYGKDYSLSENTFIFAGRDLFILDFSFPPNIMKIFFSGAKHVTWLDHHKTAFEDHGFTPNAPGEPAIEPLSKHTVILDNNKSGAMIAWEHFFPAVEPPMLFKHIDDYDRWQFKLEHTKEINKALWSHAPWSFEQWDAEFQYIHPTASIVQAEEYFALVTESAALLRDHNQKVASMVEKAEKCQIQHPVGGDNDWVFANGLVVNCPPFLTSDVGSELAKACGTFGLTWMLKIEDGKQIAACSLRSNGEYDVAAIAKAFGGGGHRNAAGFSVPISTLLRWMK